MDGIRSHKGILRIDYHIKLLFRTQYSLLLTTGRARGREVRVALGLTGDPEGTPPVLLFFRGAEEFACRPGDHSEEEGEGQDDDGELPAGGEAGDLGTGRAGEIQGDAQMDRGGLRPAAAVVDDEDVVARLAYAEVERAGFAGCGDGEKTVGATGAQVRQGGAGHESQTAGFVPGLQVEAGGDAGGILGEVALDVLPFGGGDPVDLVH